MFKKLRETWKESKVQVEAEMKAEAEKARQGRPAEGSWIPRAAHMPGVAHEFVETCRAKGLVLDYTPDTLAALDQWIATSRTLISEAQAKRNPQGAELVSKAVAWTAAYLGEMMCRQAAGTWVDVGEKTMVRVYGGDGLLPLQVAVNLLRDGAAKAGGRTFESASEFCLFTLDLLTDRLTRAVCGSYASLDELKAAMADDHDLAHRLTGTLHMALTTAHAKWNLALDFSLESVKQVESVLDRLHIMAAKAATDQKPSEDQIAGVAAAWGVYVGEVMRRAAGGTWSMPGGVLTLTIGEMKCWPTQKVRKRLVDGEADGIPFYVHSSLKMARGELDLTGS